MVSILFELDSSNVSDDDDIDLSHPEATMQYACDEEQSNVRYIVVKLFPSYVLCAYYRGQHENSGEESPDESNAIINEKSPDNITDTERALTAPRMTMLVKVAMRAEKRVTVLPVCAVHSNDRVS